MKLRLFSNLNKKQKRTFLILSSVTFVMFIALWIGTSREQRFSKFQASFRKRRIGRQGLLIVLDRLITVILFHQCPSQKEMGTSRIRQNRQTAAIKRDRLVKFSFRLESFGRLETRCRVLLIDGIAFLW